MKEKQSQIALSRRDFIAFSANGIALGSLCSIPQVIAGTPFSSGKIKAIAFDAFPIFDPHPVFSLAERLYPGKGGDLGNEWRTRQFEYTRLRVVAQRYADFWEITQDALEFAADKLNLKLGREQRDENLAGCVANARVTEKLRLTSGVLVQL